jgi:hypothetical protein
MRTISNNEFSAHPDLYLDMARDQDVMVKKGRDLFHIIYASPADRQPILEPDDDLRRAITIDELLTGVKEDLREMFAKGKQRRQ